MLWIVAGSADVALSLLELVMREEISRRSAENAPLVAS